jgi:hypothetical protein
VRFLHGGWRVAVAVGGIERGGVFFFWVSLCAFFSAHAEKPQNHAPAEWRDPRVAAVIG